MKPKQLPKYGGASTVLYFRHIMAPGNIPPNIFNSSIPYPGPYNGVWGFNNTGGILFPPQASGKNFVMNILYNRANMPVFGVDLGRSVGITLGSRSHSYIYANAPTLYCEFTVTQEDAVMYFNITNPANVNQYGGWCNVYEVNSSFAF